MDKKKLTNEKFSSLEPEEALKRLETDIGQELPKGCCLCKFDEGGYGLLFPDSSTLSERVKIVKKISKTGLGTSELSKGGVKQGCNGNFVRK